MSVWKGNTDTGKVHVLFTNGTETVGAYMTGDVYDAIPLGTNAIWEDYERVQGAPLLAAPSEYQFEKVAP
jgi:hypothetical protein